MADSKKDNLIKDEQKKINSKVKIKQNIKINIQYVMH